MHNLIWPIISIYGVGLLFIFCYSLVQLSLLLKYRRTGTVRGDQGAQVLGVGAEMPLVLVQLPVYNELYVIERLVDAAAKLRYPAEKLRIQVLDDGNDDSVDLAAKAIMKWQREGINIEHVRREGRKGFKAGALAYGLESSPEEYVAIFDADFIPDPDFLLLTLPYFKNEKIGMVQTRWDHLNRDFSLLTRVQAFALDAHFSVEQGGRNAGHHFINFNGTAGIWRRSCIDDAGGWSADTLTEDLDLSYRAQMKGWKFKFLEGVGSPAELPAHMGALKNQQYRWNKGAAECAVKHLRKMSQKKEIPVSTRLHAFFHLLNSSVFIWILVCALLSVPLVFIKGAYPAFSKVFYLGGLLIFSFVILAAFYYTSYRKMESDLPSGSFIWLYPAFLAISMGMSLHNSRAVILGFAGQRTPFIRTPKWNLVGLTGSLANKQYVRSNISFITWLEGLLAIYFMAAIYYDFVTQQYGFLPLHLLLAFGFSFVFVYAFKQLR